MLPCLDTHHGLVSSAANHISDTHTLIGMFLTGWTMAAGAEGHGVAFSHAVDGVVEGVVVAFDFV